MSGNVSLYNETNGEAILPTPTIAGVGLIPDWSQMATIGGANEGDVVVLFGGDGTHLGQSIYLRDIIDQVDGPPPPVDLYAEKRNGDFIRSAIRNGQFSACHDLSDGGLAVCLAEMAITSNRGMRIELDTDYSPAHALLFGEDQGRYVATISKDLANFVCMNAEGRWCPLSAGSARSSGRPIDDRQTCSPYL